MDAPTKGPEGPAGDSGAEALASAENTLAAIEATNAMADMAAAMRDALSVRGFATTIAEQTGVQFMFAMLAGNLMGGKK